VKGGLFWKLLLAFLVAFFVITQMIWVLVILEPPATTQDAVVAQRAASAVLDAVATALRQRGEIDAVRLRDSLPEVERTKVEILPPMVQPAPQPRSDAFIERQVEGPDGAVFRLRYHYHGATLFLMTMPIVPMIFALFFGPIFGFVMAWYLVTPIRRLRKGFERLAAGDMSVRLVPGMGGRHDEIADLAADFDVMAAQLEQSIQARERLLHDVSHELRSPLSRLQLAISLARQDPSSVKACLDRIEYEGRRLNSVVRELLSLARAESGHSPGEDYFNLTNLLESVLADARFEADTASVAIVSEVDGSASNEDAPNLHGNTELVRWALDNVVRNALRFSTSGQSVHVKLAYDGAARHYEIDVVDEGPGAPASALPTLFEPFVRADETTPGFGLGLAVAKRAVATHGGTIEASNRAGAGLALRITLPVNRQSDRTRTSG
jgi:two-component system OmpR family sensor kinase